MFDTTRFRASSMLSRSRIDSRRRISPVGLSLRRDATNASELRSGFRWNPACKSSSCWFHCCDTLIRRFGYWPLSFTGAIRLQHRSDLCWGDPTVHSPRRRRGYSCLVSPTAHTSSADFPDAVEPSCEGSSPEQAPDTPRISRGNPAYFPCASVKPMLPCHTIDRGLRLVLQTRPDLGSPNLILVHRPAYLLWLSSA